VLNVDELRVLPVLVIDVFSVVFLFVTERLFKPVFSLLILLPVDEPTDLVPLELVIVLLAFVPLMAV